jgi:hypothetical protein
MQIHQSIFQIESASFGASISDTRSKLNQVLVAWINEGYLDSKNRQANFELFDGAIYRKPIYFDLNGVATVSKIDQVLVWEQDSKLNVSVTSESVERVPLHRFVDLTPDQLLNNTPSVLAELFDTFQCKMGLDLLNEPFEYVQSRDDIYKLGAALRLQSRSSLLVLATTSAEDSRKRMQEAIWNILGTSAFLRVVPEKWFNEVNDELGISHSLPSKGFRIYLPNVNFDISQDGYRHPVMPIDLNELGASDSAKVGQLRDRLGRSDWRPNYSDVLSRLTLEGHKALRQADLELAKAASKKALNATDSEAKSKLEERIRSLQKELEEFVELASDLEAQSANSKFEAQFSYLQLEEQGKELAAARESGAYYRRILEDNQLFGEIFGHEPSQFWAEVPNTFEDLVFSIALIPFVDFTGSLDSVKDLDAQPSNASGISRCWESLRALSDYARLKNEDKFAGSFYQYLQGTQHSGYLVSSGYFAHNESESVQNDPTLKSKRLFSVPTESFSDGTAYMFAHAKLITGSSNSPRMHYLDDTSGTNKIYVGYIGAHLPTPATN